MPTFLRYLLVGTVATAVHYVLLIVWVDGLHAMAWMGAGIGAAAGAAVAYVGNARFTFSLPVRHAARGLRFLATAALGATCSMGLVALAQALGLHYLVGQVLATGASVLLTFVVNRRWTFGRAE